MKSGCPTWSVNAAYNVYDNFAAPVEIVSSSWWCSDEATYMEYALINCRQKKGICGGDRSIPLTTNTLNTPMTREVTGLNKSEKCTWYISAPSGYSPYFFIETEPYMLINSSYDIHYIEHDHKDLADEGTFDQRMKTNAKNKTVLYDKT